MPVLIEVADQRGRWATRDLPLNQKKPVGEIYFSAFFSYKRGDLVSLPSEELLEARRQCTATDPALRPKHEIIL